MIVLGCSLTSKLGMIERRGDALPVARASSVTQVVRVQKQMGV